MGCDWFRVFILPPHLLFLLTHPVWDVTNILQYITRYHIISTHTSRVGCDEGALGDWIAEKISTHTSRVGCDHYSYNDAKMQVNFYSHIPCGMWHYSYATTATKAKFLLTHPVWDVTLVPIQYGVISEFLLTHPVWDVTAIYSIFQSHYSHILQDGPIIHLELY